MRDILFRGKRKDNGLWIKGHLFSRRTDYFIIPLPIITSKSLLDPETIGQYTGLTDIDGLKIFEGDIVQLSYTGKNRGVEGKAAVIFENGKFGVKWGWHKDFVCLDGFANTAIEVIGNIYDHPELLEQEV